MYCYFYSQKIDAPRVVKDYEGLYLKLCWI